jgi:hypothetical protein
MLRDRNTLIAIQLLPLFEKDPRGWKTLIFLNHGLPHGNQSLAQHLAEWRSRCPRELRPFLSRLAAVFGVKLESHSVSKHGGKQLSVRPTGLMFAPRRFVPRQ